MLSSEEQKRIDSYLAGKYGITLSGNNQKYTLSNGAAMWNPAALFQNEVTGIFRDDAYQALQRKSQNVENANDILVESQNLDNNSALFWANNGADKNTWNDHNAPNLHKKIARHWYFQEKMGDTGEVTVSYPVSALPRTGTNNDIKILISDSDNFRNARIIDGQLQGENWVFSLNIADGEYISFGMHKDRTPPTILTHFLTDQVLKNVKNIAGNITFSDDISGVNLNSVRLILEKLTGTNWATNGTATITSRQNNAVGVNITVPLFGKYRLKTQFADNAGNQASEDTRVMHIDDVKPTITANIANNSLKNTNTFSVVVTMNDEGSEIQESTFSAILEKQNGNKWNAFPNGITTETHTERGNKNLRIHDLQDGNYRFKINVSDIAGNRADEYSVSFSVDTVNPSLEITNFADMLASKTTNGRLVYSDANSGINIATLRAILKKWNGDDWVDTSGRTTISNKSNNSADVAISVMQAGKYKIIAEVTDNAGNQISKEKEIILDDVKPEFRDHFITDNAIYQTRTIEGNISFFDGGWSGLIRTITLSANLKTSALSANLKKWDERLNLWMATQSEIIASEITDKSAKISITVPTDGKYRLEMTLRDNAGNVSDVYQRTFVVDATPPEVAMHFITDNQISPLKNLSGSITFTENINPQNINLTLERWDNTTNEWISTSATANKNNADANSVGVNITVPTFGKYRLKTLFSDSVGNSTTDTKIFYVDEISVWIERDELNIGTLMPNREKINETNQDIVIHVKTLGANFCLNAKGHPLTYKGNSIERYNHNRRFGWWLSYGGVNKQLFADDGNKEIVCQTATLQTNGIRRDYTYTIKAGALIDTEQTAGDYAGTLEFGITAAY